MSSSLTPGRWILFILINIIVSAVTAFLVFRTLVQAANNPTMASSVAMTALVPTQATSNPLVPAASAPLAQAPTVAATSQSVLQSLQPTEQAAQPTQPAQPSATPVAPPPTAVIQALTAVAPAAVAAPAGETKVRISTVVYPGQRTREAVVIVNEGDQVDMSGWTVTSPRGQTYTLPTVLLFKDSFINLHSTKGVDVPTDLFWNLDDSVWQKGDVVTLKRGEDVMATYTVK